MGLLASGEMVFERSPQQIRRGRWMLAGGATLIGAGLFRFLFVLFHPVDQFSLHLFTTMPITAGMLISISGWTLSRGPRRVTLDKQGLRIEEGSGIRQHLWSDMGWARVGTAGASQQKVLILYDRAGRKLATLNQSLQDFDDLVTEVKGKLAEQPAEITGAIQMQKARRAGALAIGFGCLMLFVAGFVAWDTYRTQRAERLLETEAIEGVGTIDRLFVAPNGVTRRVEYTVKNEAGQTGTRRPQITPAYHEELERTKAKTVPVFYVPSAPWISRLQAEELREHDVNQTPLAGYGLAAAGGLLCLFLLAAGALIWSGWDISQDPKTGKFSIKRFGEGK